VRTLPKPTNDAKAVFLTCVSRVRDEQLKAEFESIADTVENDANEYDEMAQAVSWFLIEESEDVDGVVSQKNMEKVYTRRMAAKGTPGRTIYENLKASSPHDLCPLCGHRTVEQLDHYLPKAKFPSLVVLPINLVRYCTKRTNS
jgi:hypothetical protein